MERPISGAAFYRKLCKSRTPWKDVPYAAFMPAWQRLTTRRRNALLQRPDAMYREELGGSDYAAWIVGMAARDDVALLAGLPMACLLRPRPMPPRFKSTYECSKLGWWLDYFITRNALRCVEYMVRMECPSWWENSYVLAVRYSKLPMLQLLMRLRPLSSPTQGSVVRTAVICDRLDVLEWLVEENGCCPALAGHLRSYTKIPRIVKWLDDHGCPPDSNALWNALYCRHTIFSTECD